MSEITARHPGGVTSVTGRLHREGLPPRTRAAAFRAGLIVAGWTLVALVVTGQAAVGLVTNPRPGLAIGRIFGAELLAWYFWALVTPLVWWLGRRYPLDRNRWMGSVTIHALSAVFLVTLHTAIVVPIIYSFDLLPTEPGATELFIFRMSIRFHVGLLVYTGLVALGQAMDRSAQLRQRDLRAAQVETRLVEARLTALRSQLRPHFLFNALNTVAMLIREQATDRALNVVVDVSDLLRRILKSGDEFVRLDRELDLLRSYVAIEVLRHEDRLQVAYSVTPAASAALVPSFVLQPLVENAIRHGADAEHGPMEIEVMGTTDEDTLTVEVLDNGPGLPPGWSAESAHGIGLRNVRERLEMLYETRYRFTIENGPDGGTRVMLQVPLVADDEQPASTFPYTPEAGIPKRV